MGVTQKWPDKLEYRGRDLKEDSDKFGEKESRTFLRKDELNGTD